MNDTLPSAFSSVGLHNPIWRPPSFINYPDKFLREDGEWAVPPGTGGGGGGGVSDGDKGDIIVSGSSSIWTIDNGVVTLAKMANVSSGVLLGRNTAGSGVVEALAPATVRGLLLLGTAALSATTDFATAAQGTLASTAMQPGAFGLGANYPDLDSDSTTNRTQFFRASTGTRPTADNYHTIHMTKAAPNQSAQIMIRDGAVTDRQRLFYRTRNGSGVWTPFAEVQPIQSGSTRVNSGLVTGLEFYDTTLNQPIWRNAANNAWLTFGDIVTTTINTTSINALSDVIITSATNGQVLSYDGTNWVNVTLDTSVPDGDKGDVTVSGTGTVWTIDNGVVTLAKMANVATGIILGRATAGTGQVEALSASSARTVLGLANIATSSSASDLSTGTLPSSVFDDTSHGSRAGGILHPDVTTSVSGFMSPLDKIKLDGVSAGATVNASDAALRDRATHTGTQSVSTITGLAPIATSASATDLSVGTLPAARFSDVSHGARVGGTLHADATTSVSGFMSGADKTKLNGIATGATANATDAALRDRATHTGTQAVGTITGLAAVATSASASDLTAGTLAAARMPAHTGDVTSAVGTVATTIATGVVSNAKLATVATATIKGRVTAGTGAPEDLTPAQAKTVLAIAEADVSGLTASLAGKANTTHTHVIADVTSLQTSLDAKAPLASPVLTGTPTAPTAANGTNTTQLATTAFVLGTRLDQLAVPTANVSLNAQKITNLAEPTALTDAATKNYVDSLATGLQAKTPARVATTANIATLSGLLTVDGVTLVATNRVLVKDQTTQSQNGIYEASAGAWTRTTDGDTWNELRSAYVFITEGTVNSQIGFVSNIPAAGTLGTDPVTFVQFSSASQPIAGNGLTKTGNTFDVVANSGITATADAIALNGQALALHNLATNGVIARTAAGTLTARSVASSGTGVSVTNGDGVAGNPTVTLTAALSTVGGLTPAADRLPYYTGAGTAALATFTAFGRSLVDDATNTAARTTLGLGSLSTLSTIVDANITAATITDAKLANVATGTITGRVTAGTGSRENLTPAQVKTLLAISVADVATLQASLDAKAALSHTHVQSEITGLVAALAAKSDTSHGHAAATVSVDGFMSSVDKTKLDTVSTGATANATDADLRDRATHTGTQSVATITGLATVATSGSATDLTTGTLPAGRLPAHTGDVTSPLGSSVNTIAADAVTNTKLANMPSLTIKGNNTGSVGDPLDLSVTQVRTLLGLGAAALLNTGTSAGTVATGDHTHALATVSSSGFMSATDKTTLNTASSDATEAVGVTRRVFNDLSGLLASTTSFSVGTLIFVIAQEASYVVITGPALTRHLTTAGGVILEVQPGVGNRYYASHFGAVKDVALDQQPSLAKMVSAVKFSVDNNIPASGVFDGTYSLNQTLALNTRAHWYFENFLKAMDTFPLNDYMLNIQALNGDLHEVKLACNYRAAGILQSSGQTLIHNPVIERYKVVGIDLNGTAGDTKVIQPFITQIFNSDSVLFEDDASFDGIGIRMWRADDEVIGGITRYTGTCILVKSTGKTTWISGHHPYNGRPKLVGEPANPRLNAKLIVVENGAAGINIQDCYLDNGQCEFYSPLVSMRNCRFLANPEAVTLPGDALLRIYHNGQNAPWQFDYDCKVIDRTMYSGLQDIEYMSGFSGVYAGFVANIPDGAALMANGGKFTIFHRDSTENDFETVYKPEGFIRYNYRIGAVANNFAYMDWGPNQTTFANENFRFRPRAGVTDTAIYLGSTGSNGISHTGTDITVASSSNLSLDGDLVTFKTSGVSRVEIPTGGLSFRPVANNVTNLGAAGFRWKEVFSVNGVINTSDARLKRDVRDVNEVEKIVAKRIKKELLKAYKFKDDDKIHFGILAQELAQIFVEEGLNPFDYSMLDYQTWKEEPAVYDSEGNLTREKVEAGDAWGVRYTELFAFILSSD
jgi:hypothetical protein